MSSTVSIIIPTYQRGNIICTAVDSCLVQPNCLEVLVVDDGSDDGTAQIINNKYSDELSTGRVRYIYQVNSGPSSARNKGLMLSRGKFVKFLDSDDILIEQTLETEVRHAEESSADVVVTGWKEKYYSDIQMQSLVNSVEVQAPDFSSPLDAMLKGNSPWTSAALYRYETVRNLRWDERFNKAEEWLWVWTVLLHGGTFSTLSIASAIWNHYPSGQRLTMIENPYDRACQARTKILRMVGDELTSRNLLDSSERRRKFCLYLHKDAIWASRKGYGEWRELYDYIHSVDSRFVAKDNSRIINTMIRLFGYFIGIFLYGRIANYIF